MTSSALPKNASTVILLRPGQSGGLEVFLTRRPDRMDFLGGAPGGTVRKEDYSAQTLKLCAGVSPQEARNILGAHLKPEVALGHWIAGVRELFEETGVLLCVGKNSCPLKINDDERRELERRRAKIVRGELSFQEFLESEGLLCDGRRLLYFSHWLTPEEFAMRFDTRFFVAVLPPDQAPLEKSEEVAHALWLTPERAMQLYDHGSLPMIFPTYASLRTLADFESIESVVKEFRNC